jgi:uncharacterized membrane protein
VPQKDHVKGDRPVGQGTGSDTALAMQSQDVSLSGAADRIGLTMYTPFAIILGIIGLLVVAATMLTRPRQAASLLGNMLMFGSAALIVIMLVLWFLTGDSIRSYLD